MGGPIGNSAKFIIFSAFFGTASLIVRIKYKQYKINDLACSIIWQGSELFIIIMTSHVNRSEMQIVLCPLPLLATPCLNEKV